jgi:hypothetical protein
MGRRKYQSGDPVWYQSPWHSWWPSKIVGKTRQGYQIEFFGGLTNPTKPVQTKNLKPFCSKEDIKGKLNV